MHQTKKGRVWRFRKKAHLAADAASGLVHSAHATPANGSVAAHTHEVLRGQEDVVHVNAGYLSMHKRAEIIEAQESGAIRRDIDRQVAQRHHKLAKMGEGHVKEVRRVLKRLTTEVSARVEHQFHVVKNLFRYRKVH